MAKVTKAQWAIKIASLLASAKPAKIQAVEHREILNDLNDSLGQTEWTDANAIDNTRLALMTPFTVKSNLTGANANPSDGATVDVEDLTRSGLVALLNQRTIVFGGRLYKSTTPLTAPVDTTETSLFNNALGTFDAIERGAPQDTTLGNEFFPAGFLKTNGEWVSKFTGSAVFDSQTLSINVRLFGIPQLSINKNIAGVAQKGYTLEVKYTIEEEDPVTGIVQIQAILQIDGETPICPPTARVTGVDTSQALSFDITKQWSGTTGATLFITNTSKVEYHA